MTRALTVAQELINAGGHETGMQSGIERKGTRHGPQFSSSRETAAIVPERIIGITTRQRKTAEKRKR